jgi:hypothetical protein
MHHFHHKTLWLPVIEELDWIYPREEATGHGKAFL